MRLFLRHAATAAALLTLTLSCRKIDAGPNEGISYRDLMNRPVGQQDASDWTTDKDWKKVEQELYKNLPVKVDGAGTGGYREVGFYGNPVQAAGRQASFFSNLRDTGPLHLKLVIVDQKYRKKAEQLVEATAGNRNGVFTLPLDFPADKFRQNELYRVYYVFYDDQNLRYKGHGDFLIKEF